MKTNGLPFFQYGVLAIAVLGIVYEVLDYEDSISYGIWSIPLILLAGAIGIINKRLSELEKKLDGINKGAT